MIISTNDSRVRVLSIPLFMLEHNMLLDMLSVVFRNLELDSDNDELDSISSLEDLTEEVDEWVDIFETD